MIARSKLEVRRPVYESVARDWMGPALHIHRQAGFPDLPRRLLVVAIGDPAAGAAMEVRIVHGHLCEVCISRAAERVWENEMQKDTSGGHMAFGSSDGFGLAGEGKDQVLRSQEVGKNFHRPGRKQKKPTFPWGA